MLVTGSGAHMGLYAELKIQLTSRADKIAILDQAAADTLTIHPSAISRAQIMQHEAIRIDVDLSVIRRHCIRIESHQTTRTTPDRDHLLGKGVRDRFPPVDQVKLGHLVDVSISNR